MTKISKCKFWVTTKLFVTKLLVIISFTLFKRIEILRRKMEKQDYRKKIVFWLRFSGWLCLLPASGWLWLYQMFNQSALGYMLLGELVFTVLFAVYILSTAQSERWLKPTNIFILLIITVLFGSFIILIPLCFAYNDCRKLNNG